MKKAEKEKICSFWVILAQFSSSVCDTLLPFEEFVTFHQVALWLFASLLTFDRLNQGDGVFDRGLGEDTVAEVENVAWAAVGQV